MADMCDDKKCFQHGTVRVRGGVLQGIVVSTKGKRTAIIEQRRAKKIPKYERWAKVRSRVPAHNPPCINAQVGDIVEIGETRRLSKTKAWTITKILKKGEAR
ncbi:MAG: 30S ribosomal protein S17 [Candidatus Bilamarchaeaceae archaeon]